MARPARRREPKTRDTKRIRGPNLKILVEAANGASCQRLFELADDGGLVVAINKRITKAFLETDEWKKMDLNQGFICRTGTMIGYVEPNAEFCNSTHYDSRNTAIKYVDPSNGQIYLFPIPNGYKRERNMVLVAQHPDFILVQHKGKLVVEASEVIGLEGFPTTSGLYRGDKRFDIPLGKPVMSTAFDETTRLLSRIESWIGAVDRLRDCAMAVYCKHPPSAPMSGLVEAPALITSRADTTIGIMGRTPSEVKEIRARFLDELGKVGKMGKNVRREFFTSVRRVAEVLGGAEIKK